MKLSVLLAVVLRHITVVSFLMIILDTVTCRVEVKLEFRPALLISMRVAVNEPRLKVAGGVSVGRNGIVVKSGLLHSRELDPNTRQVNVTWSSGHVNCLSLFEVSTTFSSDREEVTHW